MRFEPTTEDIAAAIATLIMAFAFAAVVLILGS